jgi:ATP-binding cassette subfamily F protein uup
MRLEANLLVFDEPTNDLDLPTLAALEQMLEGYPGTVLVVTHDRAFLDHVATAILAFEPDDAKPDVARVELHGGGYEDYVLYKRGKGEAARAPSQAPPAAEPRKPKSAKSALTYAERIELDGILDAIDGAERAVAATEAKLADPTLYAERGQEVAGLRAELESARAEAARLVARWEALERKKEEG